MFRLAATRVACVRAVDKQLLVIPKASYIRGYWPEPITQQTLEDFLKEINYFEQPKEFVNIGLKLQSASQKQEAKDKRDGPKAAATSQKPAAEVEQLDEVLDLLGKEAAPVQLNLDDVPLSGEQVTSLALTYGIHRDLFGRTPYTPNKDDISLTPDQAKRMDKLVPYFWLTDLPHSRVNRHTKRPEPLYYFDPVVNVSARFVNESGETGEKDQDGLIVGHRSYYGNVIPASEAQHKPSLTLDGALHGLDDGKEPLKESEFDNWQPGSISLVNFSKAVRDSYHTVILLNLDPPLENTSNLHWMVANIRKSKTSKAKKEATTVDGEEVCDYLPVYGVRGFGLSRYVFLAFQHDKPLDTSRLKMDQFSLESRKFDTRSFIEANSSANLVPVGLSWFQTTWDESSNKVFHNYMNAKAPVYEYVQPQETQQEAQPYPGKIPFNIYLDYRRDPKEINQQVLLERMKKVDPFDGYKDQYVPPKVPETVFDDGKIPSWMHTVMLKKKNKVGYWRGLRPASATLPLDNNADLDDPLRPAPPSHVIPPEFPNEYPARIRYKKRSELPSSKPVNEFQEVYIQHDVGPYRKTP